MKTFEYARPATVDEVVGLLEEHGADAHLLAGGTDLVLGLRGGWIRPRVVVDLKRVAGLTSDIREEGSKLTIGALTTMAEVVADERVRKFFPALAEAADWVGSVQIRNRATVAGNICNGSPAADTAPPLLVYGAEMVVAGRDGVRRVPIDDFIVGPGRTDLGAAELVTGIEVPLPERPRGSAYLRQTRRRGTDLASVTLAASVDDAGVTRLSYGSVGPRAWLLVDESGVLADPGASDAEKAPIFERFFENASPSPTSMRSSPAYRLAMLRVLGARAVRLSIERLEGSA
jgi:carbon-monoxide dehydrogenase medium subunit